MRSRISESIRQWWPGRRTSDSAQGLQILSHQDFERRLLEERARADRSDSCFTFLTISILTPRNTSLSRTVEQALIAALHENTRSTDIKGWHGNHIGLVLPYTSSLAAEKVYHKINQAYRKRAMDVLDGRHPLPDLHCSVRAHPRVHRTSASKAS